MKNRVALWMVLSLFGCCFALPAWGQAITSVRVAAGLNRPVFATAPPNDYGRLFFVEQRGVIRILDLATDQVLPTQFLNIDALVGGPTSDFDERGLLGLAFDPDYENNGYFYVDYVNNSSNTTIARYQVSGTDPNVADPSSAVILLTIVQPETNHNGGWIAFSPVDGYLYVSTGDGGGGNDQHGTFGNGQNTNVLLGKLLRLDVSSGSAVAPPDNPFVGMSGDDRIWAYGLRNPWRCSFDRDTGDIYIADVGQSAREEIDFQPFDSVGGNNYGWRCMEGSLCTGMTGCTCNAATLVDPIYEYTHSTGCAIVGGYNYRGSAIPSLQGTYFYADWCSNNIWSFQYGTGAVANFTLRLPGSLSPGAGFAITSIAGFGEDSMGEIYICDRASTSSSELYKIVPSNITDLDCNGNHIVDSEEIAYGLAQDCDGNGVPDSCDIADGTLADNDMNGVPDICELPPFIRGDCNDDSSIDLADAVSLLNSLFIAGSPPITCADSCDTNDDGQLDVSDPIYLLSALFSMGSPPPAPYPDCGIDATPNDPLGCDSYSGCP